MGLSDTALSFELLMSDAVSLCADSEIKIGIVGYGRLPLMITRRCPINNGKPCGKDKRTDCPHYITDRQGNNSCISATGRPNLQSSILCC